MYMKLVLMMVSVVIVILIGLVSVVLMVFSMVWIGDKFCVRVGFVKVVRVVVIGKRWLR